jgi:transcription initiation factor TFIIIB Brf1 subunit/transcription initiation factor TFIIB
MEACMEIICDKCGAVIPNPEWKTLRDRDIEHTYFICEDCGAAYQFAVTDKKLREKIQKYKEMAQRLKERQCSEPYQRRVQRLKEENVKRSRELRKQHPLPPLFSSE